MQRRIEMQVSVRQFNAAIGLPCDFGIMRDHQNRVAGIVQLAENVYNTTKKKFEAGVGSSFEVLQADNDWQTAQSNYFNSLYNAIIAKISFRSSLGKLD